jgi:hypothetical protein
MQLGYLDAGTGSMLVSAVVAGAAGLGVILRMSWRRITGFFSSEQRAEQRAQADQGAGAQPQAHQDPAEQHRSVSTGTGTSTEPRA